MGLVVLNDRRSGHDRRLGLPKVLRVYALLSDHFLLDVYIDPNLAFEAAEEIRGADEWTQTRPGRWHGPSGRVLEVKERAVATTVFRRHRAAS